MASNIEIVEHFLAMWEAPQGFGASLEQYFTADTVWENIGATRTVGPREALLAFPGFESGGPPIRVDMLAIAACGDRVLTERVDHILGPDGQPAMSVQVMGAFDIRDGRIVAWRDYFDTKGFAAVLG